MERDRSPICWLPGRRGLAHLLTAAELTSGATSAAPPAFPGCGAVTASTYVLRRQLHVEAAPSDSAQRGVALMGRFLQ